jgi:hypothetical protein
MNKYHFKIEFEWNSKNLLKSEKGITHFYLLKKNQNT